MQLTQCEIRLSNGIRFIIYHNIDDMIESALTNWLARTRKFTAKDFCAYIRSKDPLNIVALTEGQFNKLANKEFKGFKVV